MKFEIMDATKYPQLNHTCLVSYATESDEWHQVARWLQDNFGQSGAVRGRYYLVSNYIFIRNDEDLSLFLLRWA